MADGKGLAVGGWAEAAVGDGLAVLDADATAASDGAPELATADDWHAERTTTRTITNPRTVVRGQDRALTAISMSVLVFPHIVRPMLGRVYGRPWLSDGRRVPTHLSARKTSAAQAGSSVTMR